jgi:hypothetical protein
MNISANVNSTNLYSSFTQLAGIKKESTDGVSQNYSFQMQEQSFSYSSVSFEFQSSLLEDNFQRDYDEFQSFLSDIGYSGKPIAELNQEEAAALVSDDGFFGMQNTAERIANFVINGANGDEDLLRAGREGMLRGFAEAEAMWGGELPQISQDSIALATQMVDKVMHDLGYSILDEEA